jgi:hypothetical protein
MQYTFHEQLFIIIQTDFTYLWGSLSCKTQIKSVRDEMDEMDEITMENFIRNFP